jgi:UV DNA damage endonuclease
MNYNLGYACINMALSYPEKGVEKITTNRSMRKKTFQEKGLAYASQLTLQNAQDLLKILQWNEKNDIKFYRMSSDLLPWASEYDLKDLPDFDKIEEALFNAGLFAAENNMRITTHPGHFNKLTSPREEVIQRTIRDLEVHGEMFDLMCLPRTRFAKINIHVGATYNDRKMALDNFCKNFERLPESVRSRLTVENDDKASLYSTKELYDEVFTRIGVPIVFDYHHHKFCTGDQTEGEAVRLAASTWGDIRPVVHYSESRAHEHNDDSIRPQAHSDSYVNAIDFHELDLDVMLEAKHKEIALFKMRELLKNNLTKVS